MSVWRPDGPVSENQLSGTQDIGDGEASDGMENILSSSVVNMSDAATVYNRKLTLRVCVVLPTIRVITTDVDTLT